jgi:UDP-2-acetamido-3-amino-2,3-dideoxy-glucuronate N-acetyltransferase
MSFSCHPTAIVEQGASVGDGTVVWVNTQIREGASIGRNCTLGKDVFVDSGVKVGDRCKIQNGAQLFRGVTVGSEVFIGPCVVFTNDREPRAIGGWLPIPTVVEDGVSIGANSTIICGVRLARGCMIGAGSVVTRDVEPFSLVVGNPARRLRWLPGSSYYQNE